MNPIPNPLPQEWVKIDCGDDLPDWTRYWILTDDADRQGKRKVYATNPTYSDLACTPNGEEFPDEGIYWHVKEIDDVKRAVHDGYKSWETQQSALIEEALINAILDVPGVKMVEEEHLDVQPLRDRLKGGGRLNIR